MDREGQNVEKLPADFFSPAKNWAELFELITSVGVVIGSTGVYTAEQIKDLIIQVTDLKVPIGMITQAGGLRRKVEELIFKEGKLKGYGDSAARYVVIGEKDPIRKK